MTSRRGEEGQVVDPSKNGESHLRGEVLRISSLEQPLFQLHRNTNTFTQVAPRIVTVSMKVEVASLQQCTEAEG